MTDSRPEPLGQSIRAITRLTAASKITVSKLLCDAGKACAADHDEHVRDLKSKRIQLDEICAFICAKQTMLPTQRHFYAVALHMTYSNFVTIHSKLCTFPAIASDVSNRFWEVADILALREAVEPKARMRRGNKKQTPKSRACL